MPAPTSPVMTPMDRSLMHQAMRATASLWAAWRCSIPGAEVTPSMRLNPAASVSQSTDVSWWLVLAVGGGFGGLIGGGGFGDEGVEALTLPASSAVWRASTRAR